MVTDRHTEVTARESAPGQGKRYLLEDGASYTAGKTLWKPAGIGGAKSASRALEVPSDSQVQAQVARGRTATPRTAETAAWSRKQGTHLPAAVDKSNQRQLTYTFRKGQQINSRYREQGRDEYKAG